MLLLWLVGKARYAARRIGAYETTLTAIGKFLWGDGWRPGRYLETLRGLVQWLECHPLEWGGRLYRVVLVARLPRGPDDPFTVWIDCPPGEAAGPLMDAAFLSSLVRAGDCHARFAVNLVLFWNAAEKAAFARGEKNKKTERFIFATDALGRPSPHVRRVRRLSIDEIAAAMFVGEAPTPAARRKRRQRAREVMRWFEARRYIVVDEELGGYRLVRDRRGWINALALRPGVPAGTADTLAPDWGSDAGDAGVVEAG